MVEDSYTKALRKLKRKCPILWRPLRHAQKVRRQRLQFFMKMTGRLEGLEEFSVFLDSCVKWFSSIDQLRPVDFLLHRAGCDFVTAIEALLSGFNAVSFDTMRDVMEIEFLLSDFTAHPENIQFWLTCNEQQRRREFSPIRLRQRKSDRLGVDVRELPDTVDYRGHSMALHVNPFVNPFGGRGLSHEAVDVGADACFWDIYQHARNLVIVIREMCERFSRDYDFDSFNPPDISTFAKEYQEAIQVQENMMKEYRKLLGEEDVDVESNKAT